MPLEILQRLADHARAAGSRVAYREVGGGDAREFTYAQLHAAAWNFAARLRAVVPGGAVVMVCLPNRIEYPVAFLAALAAGCSVFPVSPEMADVELLAVASESKAAVVVGIDRACDLLAGSVATIRSGEVLSAAAAASSPGDGDGVVDLLLCSSGTTGRPKIVLRDGPALDAVSANMVEGVGFTAADRVLAVVPLCHSYGLEHGLLAPVWAGCAVHLCAGFDLAVVFDQLSTAGVTMFPSVPVVYDMMCRAADAPAFPALRKAYAAGAPLPPAVADVFHARFGLRLSQLYGMTEIGSVTYADPADGGFDARGVGRPFSGVEIRIADPVSRAPQPPGQSGEVLIRATSMSRGYLRDPSAATVDGYFPTGDLGLLDSLGNLTITGRLKLLVEVGGQKVNVLEVEDALLKHPAVAEAVVVSMRVNDTVARLRAVVTPRSADHPPTPEALRAFLRARLTAYKIPRVIDVVDALPRSAAGKVLRGALENA